MIEKSVCKEGCPIGEWNSDREVCRAEREGKKDTAREIEELGDDERRSSEVKKKRIDERQACKW